MLELAEEIIKLTNSSSKLVFKPLPGDDPRDRRPDISKAKAVLCWEPKIDREDGFGSTIEYFKTKIGPQ